MLGLNLTIHQVVDAINEGESPVLYLPPLGVYVVSIKENALGTFIYTKFTENVAQYTVRIPYSYKNTLGELIYGGETRWPHKPPELLVIPT
jgi:hypothetical protein